MKSLKGFILIVFLSLYVCDMKAQTEDRLSFVLYAYPAFWLHKTGDIGTNNKLEFAFNYGGEVCVERRYKRFSLGLGFDYFTKNLEQQYMNEPHGYVNLQSMNGYFGLSLMEKMILVQRESWYHSIVVQEALAFVSENRHYTYCHDDGTSYLQFSEKDNHKEVLIFVGYEIEKTIGRHVSVRLMPLFGFGSTNLIQLRFGVSYILLNGIKN